MAQPPSTITQNADVRFLGQAAGRCHSHLRRRRRCFNASRPYGRLPSIVTAVSPIRAASTAGLETLSLDETVAFVRSFMLFSMLANLAEDRQGAMAEDEEGGTLASALKFLSAQGIGTREAAALAGPSA